MKATSIPKPEHLDVHREGDLLVVRIRGAYDEAVAWYLEACYIDLVDRYGYRLALLDGRETTTITLEARRLMTQWNSARRDPAAGAVIGASFATKTVAKMLTRAFTLLTRLPADLDFFDSEPEARVWLERKRRELQEAHSLKTTGLTK